MSPVKKTILGMRGGGIIRTFRPRSLLRNVNNNNKLHLLTYAMNSGPVRLLHLL